MKKAVQMMLLILPACISLSVRAADSDVRKLRVGIIQVEPLSYTNESGLASGFNPDLLVGISKVCGRWEPEFVPLAWAEGLKQLQTEQIDLMMSVTATPEREKVMDYCSESIMEVWGQVFVRPGSGIESTFDLEGCRVGLMKSDANGKNFVRLAEAFGIEYQVFEYDAHVDIFQALSEGLVEAAVVPNHFGLRHAGRYNLVGTSIQFSPGPIYFAVKKGRHADVLRDIDAVMSEWKVDKTSYYYERLNYWFSGEVQWTQEFPLWLRVGAGLAVVTTLLFLVLSWLFKRQVKLRTHELAESEERYRMIVENQTDLMVKVDVEGRFLYVSPSYCEVFGKAEQELLGNTFFPMVHEDDKKTTEVEFAKVFEPPYEAYMEQRAMTRKGWRWFSWSDSAILDEEGRIKEIIGIGRDITERKEALVAHAESAERLRLASQAAQVGIWEYEFPNDRLIWDEQMFAMYDVDEATFEGSFQSWRETLHPDDIEKTEEQFLKAIEDGTSFGSEFRVVLRNGQVKHIRALAEIERDKSGAPKRAIGMNWDVTRHRQMVAALTKSEQEYRQLFENMTTGFLQLEVLREDSAAPTDFRIVQLNEAACSMAKMERTEIVGRTLCDILDPLEDCWIEALSLVALTGEPVSFENRVEALGLIVSAWIFVPKPGFLAVVVSDNSARRAAEDEVLRARQQLQHIVDNTKDVIWQIDLQGNYVYANPAAEMLTGYPLDKILSMNVLDLIVPEFHEEVKARLKNRVSGTPDTGDFSVIIRCEDGTEKWIELATNEVFDSNGKLEAVQGIARDVTERKEAERELEESRRFLRTILDMIPVGVFWKDRNLNYLGANRTFLDAIGFSTAEEIVGKDDFFINQDSAMAEGYREIDREVLASGESRLNYDDIQLARDGNVYTLLTSKMPLRNVEGEIVGVLGAYVDVTERKAAERELEESRHFLRSIIDTIPARVFWKDVHSTYQGCNLAFAYDAGLESSDQLVGKTDYDLSWAESESEMYRQDDKEVMEKGLERLNYEEPQTDAHGNEKWLSTSKVPIRDRDGDVIGVLGAYQDITSRKVLEEERIRLSAAINQSAEAMVIMDLDGFIQYVNPAFETITGYSPEEAVGANLSILKSTRHDEQFYKDIWSTIKAGHSWDGRIVNRHKSGRSYTTESAISPVKDSSDAIDNYVVAIRDVSDQVELEEHIRQAQKMDAVGRLAGGVAHDFNNILQSILGFSGILLGELTPGTSQHDDVSEIRKAARRAGDLTRQLLTLSRKHNVEYAVLDLNEIIHRDKKMMGRLIGERIEFVFDLDQELSPVKADLSQIEQIILNLFINARDAMPDGGRLLVKTYNVNEAEEKNEGFSVGGVRYVCLEVSDTGCGIRDDVREHLFEPFFTTKQVGEGTGLGLSVVYGIVQQHGGYIEVSSKVGEGAVFNVYLPACDLSAVILPDEEAGYGSGKKLEGHGEAVLVVEDDTMLRDLTERMLRDAGYLVTSVATVKEASKVLEKSEFALLLGDMVLPDGNGFELAKAARSDGADISVLLCSGYSHGQDVHEAIQANGFRYLEKPVGSMQLLQTVREMLDENHQV